MLLWYLIWCNESFIALINVDASYVKLLIQIQFTYCFHIGWLHHSHQQYQKLHWIRNLFCAVVSNLAGGGGGRYKAFSSTLRPVKSKSCDREQYIHFYLLMYSWPWSNTGLNCMDPLIHGYFSINNCAIFYLQWGGPTVCINLPHII